MPETAQTPEPVDLFDPKIEALPDLWGTKTFQSRDPKAAEFPVARPELKPGEAPDEQNQRMLDRVKELFRNGMLRQKSRSKHPLFQTAVLQVPHDKVRSCSLAVLEAAIAEIDNLISSDDPHFREALLDTRVGILSILAQVNDFTNVYKDPHAGVEILHFVAQPIYDQSREREDLDEIEWVNDSGAGQGPDRKMLLLDRMQSVEILKDVTLGTQSFEQLKALFASLREMKAIDQLSIGYFRAAAAFHLREELKAQWYRILMVSLLESSRALTEKKSERFDELIGAVNAVAAKIALSQSPNELAQAINDFKNKTLPELLAEK